ncbi:MAG: hypothetical protein PF486_00935 [Prolixibacteraceae bacterium]|jgi:hypothetical protein|nr:hypothetical protein [Prolixibacteraceae bacterium]
MKSFPLIIFLLFTHHLFAQLTTSFELGGYLVSDRDEVMFIDNSIYSPGGEIGVNFSFPVIRGKLCVETGLLFYDSYYTVKGPERDTVIWFTDIYGSSVHIWEKTNTFGLKVPISFRYTIGLFEAFAGIEMQNMLSSNNEIEERLCGSIREGPVFFYAEGYDIITLSSFNWHLIMGANIVLSPKFKVRAQYSRGMNDYATHQISPRIVNGENMGTVTQSTRTDRYKLSLVYTPQWGVKKDKTAKRAKRKQGLKNFFKDIYQ